MTPEERAKKSDRLRTHQEHLESKLFEEALQTPSDQHSRDIILKYLESFENLNQSLGDKAENLLQLLTQERQKSPSSEKEALKIKIVLAINALRNSLDIQPIAWNKMLPELIQSSDLLSTFYEGTVKNPLKKTTSNESLNSDTTHEDSYSVPSSNSSDGTRGLYQESESDDDSYSDLESPIYPQFHLIHVYHSLTKAQPQLVAACQAFKAVTNQIIEELELEENVSIFILESKLDENLALANRFKDTYLQAKKALLSFHTEETLDQLSPDKFMKYIDDAHKKLIQEIEETIDADHHPEVVGSIINLFNKFSKENPAIDESKLMFLVERQFVIDALSHGKILPTPSSFDLLVQQAKLRQNFLGATSCKVPYTTFNKTNSSSYNWLDVPIQFVLGIFAAFVNLFIGLPSTQKNEDISSPPIRRL